MDGLAAVQQGANDLVALHAAFDGQFVLMAGIESDMLEIEGPSLSGLTAFENTVGTLGLKGGLILSSSCGLYRGNFFDRIQSIYARADRLLLPKKQ